MPRDNCLSAIGAALKSTRERAKLSQAEAAKKLGVSTLTVSQWETGRRCPPLPRLPSIAEAYGIEPWDLAQRLFDSM